MRKIVQKGKIKVIQKQIVHYFCNKCGKRTGTKDNPKSTWFGTDNTGASTESHYCKRTCNKKVNLFV